MDICGCFDMKKTFPGDSLVLFTARRWEGLISSQGRWGRRGGRQESSPVLLACSVFNAITKEDNI